MTISIEFVRLAKRVPCISEYVHSAVELISQTRKQKLQTPHTLARLVGNSVYGTAAGPEEKEPDGINGAIRETPEAHMYFAHFLPSTLCKLVQVSVFKNVPDGISVYSANSITLPPHTKRLCSFHGDKPSNKVRAVQLPSPNKDLIGAADCVSVAVMEIHLSAMVLFLCGG